MHYRSRRAPRTPKASRTVRDRMVEVAAEEVSNEEWLTRVQLDEEHGEDHAIFGYLGGAV